MSFASETDKQAGPLGNNPQAVPPKRSKYHWLRGGILSILLSIGNFIYYLQTGKGLPSPRTGEQKGTGGAIALSLGAFIFGVIALFIHFRKSRKFALPPVNKSMTDFCPNCGTTLVPGASNCPVCGQLSQAQTEARPHGASPGCKPGVNSA